MEMKYVKYEYLRSLQLCEDQGIRGKLKKRVREHVFAILMTYVEIRLYMETRLKGGLEISHRIPMVLALNCHCQKNLCERFLP